MYTITKGPSKLVAQRRTGPTQQQVENRLGELPEMPALGAGDRAAHARAALGAASGTLAPGKSWPKACVQSSKRPEALNTSPSLEGTQETYTLAHEENVRFVSEAWQQVERQLDGGPVGESGSRPVQYVENTPDPRLQNFVPIDLDEWWAQQFLARITNCS